jgi:leucyl/phenylalanyl-tRNA--protein transferase
MVVRLDGTFIPDPNQADEHGLVALGGRLDPDYLLRVYAAGIFPWSSRPVITWWSPDPRAVFDLENWQPHRSVRRSARRAGWRFTVDAAFPEVIRACADLTERRPGTWITPDFIAAYSELHRRGHVHSIEVWQGDGLVGGLYGVTIGGFFGGESMFHRVTDASKAAVDFLVERLRAGGFTLLDGQVPAPHLMSLGAIELPRRDYLAQLRAALTIEARLSAP